MLHSYLQNDLDSSKLIPLITKREMEVLTLISEEYSSKEIANMLFVSIATVETHRKNIRNKLNCRNIAGVIRKSFELGLLTI